MSQKDPRYISTLSPLSTGTVSAPLDLFAVPPTQTSTLDGHWEVLDINESNTDGVLTFEIPENPNRYTDLEKTRLYVEMKVLKEDSTNLPDVDADCKVWPGENCLSSLFSKASVLVNQQFLEQSSYYPHRAYLETLLGRSKLAKSSLLKASGWHNDSDIGKDASSHTPANINKRKALIKNGQTLSLYGKIHLSTFQQEKLLIPTVALTLKFERTKNEFFLMASDKTPTGGAKIKIEKIQLHVRRVQVLPAIQSAHATNLAMGTTVKYPQKQIQLSTINLPAGTSTTSKKIVEAGQLPNRIFIMFIQHEALNGDYTLNPFRFGHHQISSIDFMVNNVAQDKSFNPNFEERKFSKEYVRLLQTCGYDDVNGSDCGLTLEQFGEGSSIFAIDLTADLGDEGTVQPIRQGYVNLTITFKNALENMVDVLVMRENDAIWELDLERKLYSSIPTLG